MRRIVAAVVLLGTAAPSLAGDRPLHTIKLLRDGLRLDERQCRSNPTALWLRADGSPFCIRYWIASPTGAPGEEALVLLHGDIGRRVNGRYVLADDDRFTASNVQYEARAVARIYPGHAMVLGRPGTYGSSGSHLAERRTVGEVGAVAAALDGLKARHGIKRFHFAGHSGGGHIVAALAQARNDVGCAVITSGALSVRTMQHDAGRPVDRRPHVFYDPIDHVTRMAARPNLRLMVVSDPDDKIVSFRSQREFVDRVREHDLPIVHITAAARDKQSHNLHAHGIRLAADCAQGMDDRALIAKYQTKPRPKDNRQPAPASSAPQRENGVAIR
jgi:pimeloyl-ACP methyl ester carboxylesterase